MGKATTIMYTADGAETTDRDQTVRVRTFTEWKGDRVGCDGADVQTGTGCKRCLKVIDGKERV